MTVEPVWRGDVRLDYNPLSLNYSLGFTGKTEFEDCPAIKDASRWRVL